MPAQGRKLMQMIGIAVNGLKTPETLVPALAELGRRHIDYGVRARDYETVGQALMVTLEQGLGADFTPPEKAAWSATVELCSGVMKPGRVFETSGCLERFLKAICAPPQLSLEGRCFSIHLRRIFE
jgi:globin